VSASNPKHGDAIIVQQRGALGDTKLVANRQFQEFLDELANVVNEFISTNDVVQQLALNESQNNKLKTDLSRIVKATEDNGQQVALIDSFLQHVSSRTRILSGNIKDNAQLADDNSQQIAVIDGSLSSVIANKRVLSSRIDDLEQLAHVN